MRPCLSRCAAVAALFAICGAQEVSAQAWLRQAIPTEIRSHDFGTVARAAKTEHRFLIKNTQQTDLHIRSARASCGCTTPIVETPIVKPGETGVILARFNTGTFTGQKAATLTVSLSYGQPQRFTELQLNVRGYIRSDVVFSPGEASFGETEKGEPQSLKLNLDYAGRQDWKIERVESPLDFLDVEFKEVSRGGGRVKYELLFKLDANAPTGTLTNQVVLHTNDRRLTTVPVRTRIQVLPPIQISPREVDLAKIKFGEPQTQRLVIKAKEPFKVLEIKSEVAEVHFDPANSPKTAHLLNITLSPTKQEPGIVTGQLVVRTDLDLEPTILPLKYQIVRQAGPAPEIAVQASVAP